MHPLVVILLLLFLFSCRGDQIIDYDTAIKNTPIDTFRSEGKEGVMEFYNKSYTGVIGAQLPVFIAKTIRGKDISQSYFEGKVSVINFWFIGCQPCEEEMPVFNQMAEHYKAEDVNFLAFSRNSPTDIEEFLINHPFNVDHIAYAEPIIQDIFHHTWGYPITFIADKNMKIVYACRGLGNLNEKTAVQEKFVSEINKALTSNKG